MNHIVEKFKCMKGKHNYIWSQTPKKATWRHLALPRPTPCPSGKSAHRLGAHRVTLPFAACGLLSMSESATWKTLKRNRQSPCTLRGTVGVGDVLPQGIRSHVADGHWPITECWLHGFWATYMLLIFCIFNHSLGSFCSWNNTTVQFSVVRLFTGPREYNHGMLEVQSKSQSSHGCTL